MGSSVELSNTSTAAEKIYWDFCPVTFNETPQVTNFAGTNNASGYGYKLVEDNGRWFGFLINRNSSRLMRLDFGTSPLNAPTMTDLGNPGGLFSAPDGFELFKEGANWFALTGKGDNGSGQIVRLSFGSDLTSVPSAVGLGTFGFDGTRARDLKVVKQNEDLVLLILGYGTNSIQRVNYGNSILNPPQSQSSIPIPGANLPIGFSVSRFDQWKLHVLSENGLVQQLDFADDITGPMTVDGGFNFLFADTPFGIQSAYSNGKNYIVISGSPKYNVVDFGDFSLSQSPTPVASGNAFLFSFAIKKYHGRLLIQGPAINEITNVVYRNDCDASVKFSQSVNPEAFTYQAPGSKMIDLTLSDGLIQKYVSHGLEIKNFQAPIVGIVASEKCVESPIAFSSTSDQPLASVLWSFGDAQTSTLSNPSHQYSAAGNYQVKTEVNGVNNCYNSVFKNIKIYNQPLSSFTLPPSPICTNTAAIFTNTTPDNFEGNLSYAWYVDNALTGDTRDLSVNFTTLGPRNIKLVTSIPGCSSETIQNTSPVQAGPTVDFMFTGVCEHESIQFTSSISEAVDSQTWDFADGSNSSEVNPSHIFSTEGSYNVSLTALSSNGCENKKIRIVTINEKPQPDFSIEGPPSSCSGRVSIFTDLTPALDAGSVETWQWNFDDGNTSNSQNPQHTFANAGIYDVEFAVTTDAGCSNTTTKSVQILQSPSVNLSNTTPCLNTATSFTGSGTNAARYYWEIGASYYETQNINHAFARSGSHVVKLTVVGNNDCVAIQEKEIVVPQVVTPTFTVTNNCKGFQSSFTSTTVGADPVASYQWNFAGEGSSAAGNPTFTFASSGNKPVTLQVTTVSGCVYQRQSTVSVIEPPQPNFSFSPTFGVPPQEISFTNESVNASVFAWIFGDGTTSTQQSPKHTFTSFGDFNVELRASNMAGCQTSVTKVVSMVAPLPDVDLNLMTLSTNADGTLRVIITIANKGNTFLRNLPIRVDVSGEVTLETLVTETIAPFSQYNLVLNYGIAPNKDLDFICASASLAGDLHPEGNRICNQLKAELAIIKPYPNPAVDLLTVEWVAQGDDNVQLVLVDSKGQTILSDNNISSPGLNQKGLDLQNVRPGVYILRIIGPNTTQTHRILVSN